MRTYHHVAALVSAAILAGGATNAFASGFEKSVPFSGKMGGIVGAGASVATGAEALFFNPAALSGASERPSLTLNFSPSLMKSEGVAGKAKVDSGNMFSPFFGGFADYGITEKLGLGLGFYVAGGSSTEFTKVDPTDGVFFNDGVLKSQLQILEGSLGLGYQLTDDLHIGAAYRLALVSGEFSQVSATGAPAPSLAQVNFSDLADTQHGFRAGIMYAPKDAGWGLGAMFRSAIDFTVEGKFDGKIEAAGAHPLALGCAIGSACTFSGKSATLSSSFPMQANIGSFYDVSSTFRTVLEFSFTQYAKNNQITAKGKGDIKTAAGADTGVDNDLSKSPIALNWRNQLQGKIGFIYTGVQDWTLRTGYSYVSQVVPAETAAPTFTSPGAAHYASLGAGTRIGEFGVDAAYEFTTLSGKGSGDRAGDYAQTAHAFHLGVSMHL